MKRKSISIYAKAKSVVCLCGNRDLVDKFHDSERFDVTQKLTIETTTIDATVRQDVDFIKMDIQGGELAALQGAEGVLGGTLGLELEVEFYQCTRGSRCLAKSHNGSPAEASNLSTSQASAGGNAQNTTLLDNVYSEMPFF